MTLSDIEQKLVDLHGNLSLRTTLLGARKIGELLHAAKKLVKRGQWLPWLQGIGIKERTAQIYLQVFSLLPNPQTTADSHLSIDAFLLKMRQAKRQGRLDDLEELRKQKLKSLNTIKPDKAYRIINADCRKHKFQKDINVIATDPIWNDHEAFTWLGQFAAENLREGGLLLTQCGVSDLADVLPRLASHGLKYLHILAIAYEDIANARIISPWIAAWRPVLVLSKGKHSFTKVRAFSDVFTVRGKAEPDRKNWHDWQQPIEPWLYWLSRLTQVGDVICDPFAGSGTNICAVKMLGNRVAIGTEKEKKWCNLARIRLAGISEGVYQQE